MCIPESISAEMDGWRISERGGGRPWSFGLSFRATGEVEIGRVDVRTVSGFGEGAAFDGRRDFSRDRNPAMSVCDCTISASELTMTEPEN